MVQVGWYAQGHDASGYLLNGLVTAIDQANERITIALPNKFVSGRSYIFTSDALAPPISNICFPSGTPVTTDQCIIAIDKIDINVHTIFNKKIIAVTKTVSIDEHLVCFDKDALGQELPSQRTCMSKNHVVFFKGEAIKAQYFVNNIPNVRYIDYAGEPLYNILLEEYGEIIINNMIVETLHPTNRIATLYNSNYTIEQRNEIVMQMNTEIASLLA